MLLKKELYFNTSVFILLCKYADLACFVSSSLPCAYVALCVSGSVPTPLSAHCNAHITSPSEPFLPLHMPVLPLSAAPIVAPIVIRLNSWIMAVIIAERHRGCAAYECLFSNFAFTA